VRTSTGMHRYEYLQTHFFASKVPSCRNRRNAGSPQHYSDIEKCCENPQEISVKLDNSESLRTLLSDSLVSHDLKVALRKQKHTGSNTSERTGNAKDAFPFWMEKEQGNTKAHKE